MMAAVHTPVILFTIQCTSSPGPSLAAVYTDNFGATLVQVYLDQFSTLCIQIVLVQQ